MAKGNNNGPEVPPNGDLPVEPVPVPPVLPLSGLTQTAWREAAAAAGFPADQDGNPMIPISGDEGVGYYVSVQCPVMCDMENLVRMVTGHAIRVGQSAIKAKGAVVSLETATAGANSACNGGYKPQRERSNEVSPIDKEADRRWEALVRARATAAKPDISEKDMLATLKAQAQSEQGKAKLAEFKAAAWLDREHPVSRKGKVETTGGTAVEVNYDE